MEKDDVIQSIKGCLVLHKDGTTLSDLRRDFFEIVGKVIPYQQLGYDTLESLVLDIPGVYCNTIEGKHKFSIHSDKTQHIKDLVDNQRPKLKSKKKHVKGSFGYTGRSNQQNSSQQRNTKKYDDCTSHNRFKPSFEGHEDHVTDFDYNQRDFYAGFTSPSSESPETYSPDYLNQRGLQNPLFSSPPPNLRVAADNIQFSSPPPNYHSPGVSYSSPSPSVRGTDYCNGGQHFSNPSANVREPINCSSDTGLLLNPTRTGNPSFDLGVLSQQTTSPNPSFSNVQSPSLFNKSDASMKSPAGADYSIRNSRGCRATNGASPSYEENNVPSHATEFVNNFKDTSSPLQQKGKSPQSRSYQCLGKFTVQNDITSKKLSSQGNMVEETLPDATLLQHQLIGDDFLLTLSLVQIEYEFSSAPFNWDLCISGMTIRDCIQQIKYTQNIKPYVILLVGAMDILQGRSFENIRRSMQMLIQELSSRVHTVVILTTPPLIMHSCCEEIWNKQIAFNEWLIQQHGKCGIQVVDIWNIFVDNEDIASNFFCREPCFPDNMEEEVMLWNKLGVDQVTDAIKNQVLSLTSMRENK